MRKHIINGILKKAELDDRIVLMVGDLGYNVVEEFRDRFPNRFFNCGIAESNMMSVATGMALEGDVVFVYSIGNFPTLRCLEQIRNCACYHNADVKIISVGGGFSYGTLGMTHHATEEIGILRTLPNIRIYAPADPYEADAVLEDMLINTGPCYVRLARGKDRSLHDDIIRFPINQLIPFREYSKDSYEVTILVTGPILEEAIKAESKLNEAGVYTRLFSVPTVKPIDELTIIRIASSSKYLVTMEEHSIFCGLGGAVSEILAETDHHSRLIRFGLKDVFSTEVGSRDYLRAYYEIDHMSVYKCIMKMVMGE